MAGWIALRFLNDAKTAEKHFAELQKLLAKYARVQQPYFPRTIMKKEDDPSDYDHLSRFQEWTLSGGGT